MSPSVSKLVPNTFEPSYLLVDDVVAISFAVPYARRQAVLLRLPLHRSKFLPRLDEIPLLVLVVVRPRNDIVVVCTAVLFLGRLSKEPLLFDHALFVLLQEPGIDRKETSSRAHSIFASSVLSFSYDFHNKCFHSRFFVRTYVCSGHTYPKLLPVQFFLLSPLAFQVVFLAALIRRL